MDLEEKFAERLAQLRSQKNISAREMSLVLGQGAGYIYKIHMFQCKRTENIRACIKT